VTYQQRAQPTFSVAFRDNHGAKHVVHLAAFGSVSALKLRCVLSEELCVRFHRRECVIYPELLLAKEAQKKVVVCSRGLPAPA
jgi:hypothetical protein